MRWKQFFKYLALFILLPIISWLASLISTYQSPCNIAPDGKFALAGLSKYVEAEVEEIYPKHKIYVAQSGCDIDFRGPDVKEYNRKTLEKIAGNVEVNTARGRLKPVRSITFSELDILSPDGLQKNSEDRLQQLEINQYKNQISLNTIWVLISGSLVFFMNAGFAALETGFCRIKNSATILAKNLVVFSVAAIAFWALGFGLMFGDGNPIFGTSGFFLISHPENSPTIGNAYRGVFRSLNWAAIPLGAKFFFQLTFASTAATIVSGAVAERIRFKSFFLFVPLFTICSYAVVGHWIWGGGLLQEYGFWDFAGSTVVHAVGGMAGLVGTLILRPRLGKYRDYYLSLISCPEIEALPEKGKCLVIAGKINDIYHARIFDSHGRRVIDSSVPPKSQLYQELSEIQLDIWKRNRLMSIDTQTHLVRSIMSSYNYKQFKELQDFRRVTFRNRRIESFKPDSLSFATLGCLILWLGWFGFNAGSVLEANPTAITHVLLNTAIAGATGSVGSLIGAWIYFEKPSIAFLINGILAGCVSITASCAYVGIPSAAMIGFIGGILVNFLTILLDKAEVDDPVGAIPVHLGCGFWGTLAVGLFSEGSNAYLRYGITNGNGPETGIFLGGGFSDSLLPQFIGCTAVLIYTALTSLIIWRFIGWISGGQLRISLDDERNRTSPDLIEN
jgi:ammonia channel protein AmtB